MTEIIYDSRRKLHFEISVIIPVYNLAYCVKNCVKCISKQSFHNFECLFIDDGSTDCTIENILECKNEIQDLCIISQTNQHAGIARNTGIAHAHGKYFIFLDGDDIFEPTLLQNLHEAITSSGANMAICNAYFLDAITGERSYPEWILKTELLGGLRTIKPENFPNSIFSLTSSAIWTKLISSKIIKKLNLRFQSLLLFEDVSFSYKCLLSASKIAVVSDRLVGYTVRHKTSHTSSSQNYNLHPLDIVSALDELYDFMTQSNILKTYAWSFYEMAFRLIQANIKEMSPTSAALLATTLVKKRLWHIQNSPLICLRHRRKLRRLFARVPKSERQSVSCFILKAFIRRFVSLKSVFRTANS